MKIIYKKLQNRTNEILRSQACDIAERIMLPLLCGGATYFKTLINSQLDRGADIYYDFIDYEQDSKNMVYYFNNHSETFEKIVGQFNTEKEQISQIVLKNNEKDFELLYYLLIQVWAKIAIFITIGETRKNLAVESISKTAYSMRFENDKVIYEAFNSLLKIAKNKISSDYYHWLDVLTFQEIVSLQYPSKEILEERKKGYILFEGKIYTGISLDQFTQNHKPQAVLSIESNSVVQNICGTCTSKGKAQGKAKIVFGLQQMGKVKEGDILVTPMTSPDMIPILGKVAAIVTDEGGMLCHAAIASREFNVPCITGTKNATSVLKDEDIIEVDAENGIVNIISSFSPKSL